MCIGLVHDIFTRNIYYGVDMKIDRINELKNTMQFFIDRDEFIVDKL